MKNQSNIDIITAKIEERTGAELTLAKAKQIEQKQLKAGAKYTPCHKGWRLVRDPNGWKS
jgi:hypothetical protein